MNYFRIMKTKIGAFDNDDIDEIDKSGYKVCRGIMILTIKIISALEFLQTYIKLWGATLYAYFHIYIWWK